LSPAALSVAHFLSPSSAPLLLLVVPIAVVGRRWGASLAWAAAIVAVSMVAARNAFLSPGLGTIGMLTRATAFVTVAMLADRRRKGPDQARIPGAHDGPRAWQSGVPVLADLLTEREVEVLEMMAQGATNAEIADRLVIAPSTVQSHVKNILRKLEVKNRTHAVARYLGR
jgi:DNA-binding NarL/FixJ family response regulator